MADFRYSEGSFVGRAAGAPVSSAGLRHQWVLSSESGLAPYEIQETVLLFKQHHE